MDEKTLTALADASAVKQVRIIADGARFHVEAETPNSSVTVSTLKGTVKTWGTLDTAANWVRSLGIGHMLVDIARWQPGQKGLSI
jgi:hypothetical protein